MQSKVWKIKHSSKLAQRHAPKRKPLYLHPHERLLSALLTCQDPWMTHLNDPMQKNGTMHQLKKSTHSTSVVHGLWCHVLKTVMFWNQCSLTNLRTLIRRIHDTKPD